MSTATTATPTQLEPELVACTAFTVVVARTPATTARLRPKREGTHERNSRRGGLRSLGLHLRRREDAARLPRTDRGGGESYRRCRRGGHGVQPGGARTRGMGRWRVRSGSG